MSHLHPLPPVGQQPSCKTGATCGGQARGDPQPCMGSHSAQASVVCMEQDVSSMGRSLVYPDVLCCMGSRQNCAAPCSLLSPATRTNRDMQQTPLNEGINLFKAISNLRAASSQSDVSAVLHRHPVPLSTGPSQGLQTRGHVSYSSKREHWLLAKPLLDQSKVTIRPCSLSGSRTVFLMPPAFSILKHLTAIPFPPCRVPSTFS